MDWMEEGACAGSKDPDLFFREDRPSKMIAKNICRSCPVVRPCLLFAVAHRINYGVWGGKDDTERRRISRQDRVTIRNYWFAQAS